MGVNTVQPAFVAGVWSPALGMRIDLQKYALALASCENCIIHPHGGISNRGGTEYCIEAKYPHGEVRLIQFQFNTEQSYVLEFGEKYIRVHKDGGLITNPETDEVVEITTDYLGSDLKKIRFKQSADKLYLVHPLYQPATLSRFDHHLWEFNNMLFGSSLATPVITSSTDGTNIESVTKYTELGSIKYKVTAYNENDESIPTDIVLGGEGEVIKWEPVEGAIGYSVYRNDYGTYGWIKDVPDCEYKVKETKPDLKSTIPVPCNPFEDGFYPSIVEFHEERLILGNTNKRPNTFWGSRTGNFTNFNKSEPLRDDDSYEFTITSGQLNGITAMVSMDALMLLTAGAEHKVTGIGDKGITPSSVMRKRQSGNGSAPIEPLLINDSIIYISNACNAVQDMAYKLEADGYQSNDLSILATHLFKGKKIVAWAFQRNPDSIIWCVRDDGVLLGLTYKKDQQVWAWHHHSTQGRYKDVCVASDGDGSDEVYFVIEREINGTTKKYIERLHERLKDNDIRNSFFVDSGMSLISETEVSSLSKLEHLAGMEVVGVADGSPIKGVVTPEGTFELPQPARQIQIGLGYESLIESMEINISTENGSSLGKIIDITKVYVAMENTATLSLEASGSGQEGDYQEIDFRTDEGLGDPLSLFTGKKEVSLPGVDNACGGKIYLRNNDPLPVTINGLIPEIEYGQV